MTLRCCFTISGAANCIRFSGVQGLETLKLPQSSLTPQYEVKHADNKFQNWFPLFLCISIVGGVGGEWSSTWVGKQAQWTHF